MADQPGSHGANIIVDLDTHSFQDMVRAAINHQAEVVIADLEAAYHSRGLDSPQVRGAQVIVSINYNVRPLDSEADLRNAVAQQDRTRLESESAGTDQLDTEDLPDAEARPTLLPSAARLLESLPVISLDDLQDDSRSCPVVRHFSQFLPLFTLSQTKSSRMVMLTPRFASARKPFPGKIRVKPIRQSGSIAIISWVAHASRDGFQEITIRVLCVVP